MALPKVLNSLFDMQKASIIIHFSLLIIHYFFGGDLIIKYFIFLLILINIVIPILFINIFYTVGADSISAQHLISLYIKETDEIKNIPFEEYIAQVTYAEVPASFEIEAIKAQSIAARTYTYKKLKNKNHEKTDMCNDPNHCQAFKAKDDTDNYKKVAQAVEDTRGKIITYNKEVINAVYHASSGGFTESAANVWIKDEDYLVAVESAKEDEIMKNYMTEVLINKKEFFSKLNLKNSNDIKIKILSKTEGNRVKEISINGKIFTGNEIRNIFNLRSTKFEVFYKNADIKFVVEGYGHGVGLSQWGAQVMALEGKKCEEILKHYYTGVEIEKIMNNE